MDSGLFIQKAKDLVAKRENISADLLFVPWSSKTLQNNKCTISAPATGFPYYEVTFDGDKNSFYVDKYIKASNEAVKMEDI